MQIHVAVKVQGVPARELAARLNALQKTQRLLPLKSLVVHGIDTSNHMSIVSGVVSALDLDPAEDLEAAALERLGQAANDDVSMEFLASSPTALPLVGHERRSRIVHKRPDEIGGSNKDDSVIPVTPECIAQFDADGISVFESVLMQPLTSRLYDTCLETIGRYEKALAAKEINVGQEDFMFAEVSSRQRFRFDLLLPKDHPINAKLGLDTAPWLPLVCELLGLDKAEVCCQTSIVYSKPGAEEQTWHADGPHVVSEGRRRPAQVLRDEQQRLASAGSGPLSPPPTPEQVANEEEVLGPLARLRLTDQPVEAHAAEGLAEAGGGVAVAGQNMEPVEQDLDENGHSLAADTFDVATLQAPTAVPATGSLSGNKAPPYALCVFVPLIDLDAEVGFTQFWPGTHLSSQLVGFGPVAPLVHANFDGICPAGSAVIYDYRLIHRGMPNRSNKTLRPLLQFLYHQASYQELRNYGDKSLFATDTGDGSA